MFTMQVLIALGLMADTRERKGFSSALLRMCRLNRKGG